MADVLIARETAVVAVNGQMTRVLKNITRVAVGSDLAKQNPDLFRAASDDVGFPTRTARSEPKPAVEKAKARD